jgi:cell division ATPase FtsA
MSDDLLMELFARYTAWQNYAAVEMSNSEVAEASAEANVRFTEAQAMVKGWGGSKDKVTVAKAEMTNDTEVVEARDKLLGAYARRKMTQVIYANCERCVFVISRELSRRIGNVGFERRNNRWNP